MEMQNVKKVLLIEDSPLDVQLVRHALPEQFDLQVCNTLATGLEQLKAYQADLILLDLELEDASRVDGLIQVKKAYPGIPVIVLTNHDRSAFHDECIRCGAHDYYEKSDLINPKFFLKTVRYTLLHRQFIHSLSHSDSRELRPIGQMGTWELDIAASSLRFCEKSAELMGGGQKSINYDQFLDLLCESDRDRMKQLGHDQAEGQSFQLELELPKESAACRRLLLSGEVEKRGEKLLLYGVMQDLGTGHCLLSNVRFNKVLSDQLSDAAFACDTEWNILYANRSAVRDLGIRVGGNFADWLDKWSLTNGESLASLRKQLLSGLSINLDIKRLSGFHREKKQCYECLISPQTNGMEEVEAFMIIAKDVVLHRELQSRVEAEEAIFRKLIEHSPTGMALVDIKSRSYVDCNPAFEALIGMPKSKILTLGFDDITPAKYASLDEKALKDVKKSGRYKSYRKAFFHNSGKQIPVLIIGFLMDDDRRDRYWNIILDLSELEETSKALKETEKRFKLYMEESTDVVYSTSLEGCFSFLSPNVQAVLGYSSEEIIGSQYQDLIHAEDASIISGIFQEAKANRGSTEYAKFRMKHSDGTYKWFECSVLLQSPAKGKKQFIGILRNIEKERANEAKIRLQNERLREIAFIQSHILRRPLANVLGLINLIRMGTEISAESARFLELLSQEACSLDLIVSEIVDRANAISESTEYAELDLPDGSGENHALA